MRQTLPPIRLRRLAPLALLFALLAVPAQAQDCPGTDYRFSSQEAVDAFPGGCSTITGTLAFSSGPTGSDITDLSPLGGITSVEQNLTISDNPQLASLDGLSAITFVGSAIDIRGNALLTSIEGLGGLTSIYGQLNIESNPLLASLAGLDGVTSAGSNLNVFSNAALTSLDGLGQISVIGGALQVLGNGALSECAVGLSGVISGDPPAFQTGILGNVAISGNDPSGACNSIQEVLDAYAALAVCPDTDYTLSSQAAVDAFPGGCSIVSGGLHLAGDITDLSPLSGIASVGGTFQVISTTALTSLDGLQGLTSIGNSLQIAGNAALASLDGLQGMASVEGNVLIQTNDLLTSLHGLSGLTSIGGVLEVRGSPGLTSLAGLEGLTSLAGGLNLFSNDALASLDGLQGLTSTTGIKITGNDVLTSLDGLDSLTEIDGRLELAYNPVLASIAALQGVTSLDGGIRITANAALTSLDGLGAIHSITGSVYIAGNPVLASLSGLEGLTHVQILEISGNALLSSLDALSGVTSIGHLGLSDNPILGECAVGLSGVISGDPPMFTGITGVADILTNDPDGRCNSEQEVLDAYLAPVCPAGFFSATGNAPCVPAPPGTFVASLGATQPSVCEPGTYQPESAQTSCHPAEPGFFVSEAGALVQEACSVGTYSSGFAAEQCTRAEIGFYVDMVQATEATACPAGQTTAAKGSTSAADCFAITAGLTVSITPLGNPDVGPYGGLVFFRVQVDNDTDERLDQTLWLTLTTPSGDEHLQFRTRVRLRPGRSARGLFVSLIRRRADAGTYTYTASVGDYPAATDSDAFSFVKHDHASGRMATTPAAAAQMLAEAEARTGGPATADVEARLDGGDPTAVWGETDDAAWEAALSGTQAFELAAPFPNPTRGQTAVVFAVETATTVRLAVYDALGREVAMLAEGPVEAGAHRASLDGAALPTGVYLVRLTTADGQTATQRLTVVR